MNIVDVINACQNVGLKLTVLSRNIGMHKNYLALAKFQQKYIGKEAEIMAAVNCCIDSLRKYSFSDDWDSTLKKIGLREKVIADKLGISRQALNEQKKNYFPDERQQDILFFFSEMAEDLESAVKKYNKAKKNLP